MKIRKLKAFSNLYIFMKMGSAYYYVGKIKEWQKVDFGPLTHRFVFVPFMNLYDFVHAHFCCNVDGDWIRTAEDEEILLNIYTSDESEELPF